MRVNINLASQKYEDVRRFHVLWGSVIAGTAGLTVLLLVFAAWNYADSSQVKQRIKEKEQKIATLERERASAQAVANLPQNRGITEQKNYWNGQIAKRSLSWTQLFNDLQRIMPPRAYLNAVHPEITLDHRLKLQLVIISDKHDGALELVKKMEKSERFSGPSIGNESVQKDAHTGGFIYKVDISTYYNMPTSPASPQPGNKESM